MVTRRLRRRARGLTLIEVMVALLITTIALLGALATVGITVRGANFSRNATEASVLAQTKLEQEVSLPQGSTSTTLPASSNETGLTAIDANGMTGNSNSIYSRSTTWSLSSDGLRRVCTVIVSWTDGLGVPHYVYASRQQDLQ